jgi:hypothetical protein
MFKTAALLLLVLSFQCINAQITIILEQHLLRLICALLEEETWGKVFNLSDFGIAPNEQFVIKSGQIELVIRYWFNYIFSLYCWWKIPWYL